MKYLITICARGGSKGVPGKNIKKINGKPLIWYTINTAKIFAERHKADIAISTDNYNIKRVAEDFGISSNYLRPDFLATDSAGKIDTIKDVWKYYEKEKETKYDFIMDLDVTSPLRTIYDLEGAIKILSENEDAINIFSVSKAHRNPYFNMVEQKENGFFDVVKKDNLILSRQDAPLVYDVNASFYIYKRSFFERNCRSAITDTSIVFPMNHICFDLDEPIDFDFMEYLSNKKIIDL